jgi:hypothetical protein
MPPAERALRLRTFELLSRGYMERPLVAEVSAVSHYGCRVNDEGKA